MKGLEHLHTRCLGSDSGRGGTGSMKYGEVTNGFYRNMFLFEQEVWEGIQYNGHDT